MKFVCANAEWRFLGYLGSCKSFLSYLMDCCEIYFMFIFNNMKVIIDLFLVDVMIQFVENNIEAKAIPNLVLIGSQSIPTDS